MAYMSQERKRELAPQIKSVLNKYGLKGTLGVDNHSTLVLTIKSGKIDFLSNCDDSYHQVNEYHIQKHYAGDAQKALSELKDAMMVGNHNNSDLMTDYFDVGWYISINIGKWDKPYVYNAPEEPPR